MLLPRVLALSIFFGSIANADELTIEPGFIRLDNGADLKGWTPDDGWRVIDGAIHVDVKKAKGNIHHEKLHSANFLLKLQFRAPPKGDSGVYLHGKQFQIRDYPAAGPAKYAAAARPAGEWNQLEFDFIDGLAVVKLNGQIIERAWKIGIDPKKGIGLQKEAGDFDFRYILLNDREKPKDPIEKDKKPR